MKPWLELLAQQIAASYRDASPGHAARLNGLREEEARELRQSLRKLLPIHWDVMVVANLPEAEGEVAIDEAIERRNDKSQSRLFIVPLDMVDEATASLNDTESHEVTEYLKPVVRKLLNQVPSEVREVARVAMKWTPDSARLDYLSSLSVSPTMTDCGRELWRLGLIPDLAPRLERFADNRDCVKRLTQGEAGSIHRRVETLGLGEAEVKDRLIKLLRQCEGQGPLEWVRRIAQEPQLELTFDCWTFPDREEVELRAIELHSFYDPKKHSAYKWSGLTYNEGTLKASLKDLKARVTVRFTTDPETPEGTPVYEVSIETTEAQPIVLLGETQKHQVKKKVQSWSFRPSEIEGIEAGSLRVRVVVRAFVPGRDESITGESDEFLLVSEEVEKPESTTSFKIVRSVPDFLLDRASLTRAVPQVTLRVIEAGAGVKVELDERQRRRIVLNPVLLEAESHTLNEPGKLGAFDLNLSAELRWNPEDLTWLPQSEPPSQLTDDWRRARRRIFTEIGGCCAGQGVVEAADLSELLGDILTYCRGYARALEGLLDEHLEAHAAFTGLLFLDSIKLWQDAGSGIGNERNQRLVGALLSPLHPLRLLWHLAHEALVIEWINKAADRSQKLTLPSPPLALEVDGGNFPAFLGSPNVLLYYLESPLFHWPLYISASEEDPHRLAAMVRWGLGMSATDAQASGQASAVAALSDRLASYVELHPYVKTLKVNAVNVGDGQLLVKALSSVEDQTPEETEVEPEAKPNMVMGYEVRLYGPPPVYQIGSFLDECAGQRRRGQGLPLKLDRLFRPGDSFLRPHLFWAKRDLKIMEEAESGPPEEAHVSFVNEYFCPRPGLVAREGPVSAVSTYGLQTDLVSDFISQGDSLAWYRTVRLPDDSHFVSHPADKRLTSVLVLLHRLMLKAAVRLQGGVEEGWPATEVPVGAAQFQLFSRLHESSDWVLTVDRNLGVELFDSPEATQGELRDNAKRFLIDYAPAQVGSGGQQLMISTAWVEEVSELLRETLREMLITPSDLACEEVLSLLKSISGRLVMRVARYPEVAKEAVSLAVVREVLRGRGELDKAFLVPVDEHIPIFLAHTSDQSPERRRPDLLLVRPRLDKKGTLEIDLIEVKYRRHRAMAYDRGLWHSMMESTRAGQEALSRAYFPGVASLDLPLRRRQLKGILAFYARRAVRHALLDPETGEKFQEWLDHLQREDLGVQFQKRGFIYSPEIETEEGTDEDNFEDMRITLIGRNALPRYTSFHPTEPPTVPPRQDQSEPPLNLLSSGETGKAQSQVLFPTEKSAVTPSESPPTHIESKPDIPSKDLKIVLGLQLDRHTPVHFRPTIKGNPHALIVGIPGMGKTTSILNIAVALSQADVQPFVVDFHGDIARGLKELLGASACHVLDAGEGLPFNPLELDQLRQADARGWKLHCFEVAEILSNLYPSFGELQVGLIRRVLQQCYEGAGFGSSFRDASAPQFQEFWRCLSSKAETDREARKIATRLEPVFHLGLFREDLTSSFSLAELLARPTVLDLHRLELEENQRVAASFFLQRLYRDMFSHGEENRLRNAVVLDEAHRVARLSLIPRMMQECRKYGILFLLASQRVEDFNQGVLDSAGNHLYMRVNHPDARRLVAYLGTITRSGDLVNRLQNLPKYHALFRSEEYQPYVMVHLADVRMS